MQSDPTKVGISSQESSSASSLTEKEWSSIAAHLPQSTMRQLAVGSTTPESQADPQAKKEVISRDAIVRKLKELEYHSLAAACETGWLLLGN